MSDDNEMGSLCILHLKKNNAVGNLPYLTDKSIQIELPEDLPTENGDWKDFVFFKWKSLTDKKPEGLFRVMAKNKKGHLMSQLFEGKISPYRF